MLFIIFSKIKRGFDREGKRAVALLATITLLCSFTGCAGNEAGSAVPDSVTSVLQSTHVSESKDSQDSETNSDNTSSSDSQNEPCSSQSDFDFDEAVKNITLFGSGKHLAIGGFEEAVKDNVFGNSKDAYIICLCHCRDCKTGRSSNTKHIGLSTDRQPAAVRPLRAVVIYKYYFRRAIVSSAICSGVRCALCISSFTSYLS